jgi:hypothetical protein
MQRGPVLKQTGSDNSSDAGNLLQFLAWVDAQPRTYAQTMEAWRTSCPRLSTWEDATAGGLVDVVREECESVLEGCRLPHDAAAPVYFG